MRQTIKVWLVVGVTSVAATQAIASWFLDRDNSMEPANDLVGDSMAIYFSKNNSTIATQVYCPANPGTVLGVAHGIIDNPQTALEQNRAHRDPVMNAWDISSFPISDENWAGISTVEQFTSPRTDPKSDWSNPGTDYAFVTPDRPLNPENEGVQPLDLSSSELISLVGEGELEVFLYRANPSYELNNDGTPDLEGSAPDTRAPRDVYTEPQRVSLPCDLFEYGTTLTGTYCPVEQGVSGSPFIAFINDNPFLVGVAKQGSSDFRPTSTTLSGGAFLNSRSFCDDYSNVCGVSCISLEDLG